MSRPGFPGAEARALPFSGARAASYRLANGPGEWDMTRTTDPSPIEIQRYLEGVDYPADNNALTETARRNGAPEEVADLLERLPEKEYNSPAEVMGAYGSARKPEGGGGRDVAGRDPRLAVVTITHNRREELLRTLSRLTTLPERPQIVVVVNGSTDGTASAVARSFPEVELLELGANLGPAGRTLGVERVSGPYIAFCDDDSWWRPGALRRAADLFDRHPRLAVINGHILVGPEEREDPLCRELAASPLPAEPGLPGPRILGFMAGMSVVRRAAYVDVVGFNPRIYCGEEEWLAADLAARGWQLCYVPDLVVHHHPSPRRDGHGRRAEGICNTLWFTWLRRPPASALRRSLRMIGSLPRDRVSLRGLLGAVVGLPRMLRDYRVVPPEVERDFRLLDGPQMNSRARRYVS
jgi:GT2 family glycosyltransferase